MCYGGHPIADGRVRRSVISDEGRIRFNSNRTGNYLNSIRTPKNTRVYACVCVDLRNETGSSKSSFTPGCDLAPLRLSATS